MKAFSRPSSSSQEDYVFRGVSEFNCLARTTAGLRSLYEGIRSGDSQKSSADNSYSNSDGHFVPRQDMILACRYRVISCIETSGQSAVLLEAEDSFSKMMPVVIKVMHTSYFAVGLKEMQTLRKMNSADPREMSHTIRLLNSFTFESHVCLVFPLLNPLPLTTVIARKCLSKDEMLSVVRKISLHLLSALAFLRSHNIIHADIKPENILMHKDGDVEKGVTLIDFGNAIPHTHQEVSLYYTDFELQTQPYRAPEVHLGHSFGVEVDMWSFGCVLLELLTGQSMFAGTDRADSLQKMMAVLGPLPTDMCKRGKFYADLASVLPVVSSSQKVESGSLRLMSAFPCIRNYDFASFLSGLLTYQPDKRLTPWEALQHPFMAPLICIPFFVSDTTIDTGVIKKSDYNFRQNISSNRHHLRPSTFDLLHAGTSDWPLIEHANVALVEPFGLISRPRKDVISQQKCDKKSPIMQGKGVECIVSSKMTTAYRTGKCVSSDWSIKREQPHQRNTITQELHQPNVSEQEATLLIDRVKEDHINSSFSMYKSKSQRDVLEIGQSQKVNSSNKSTSKCTTGTQSSSVGSKSHQGKLTGLANDDHPACESSLMDTAGAFSANSQSCHFQESQLSRTENHCEISEGANTCVKSEGANTCVKSEGANTCVKSEGANTCVKSMGANTCMKSEGSGSVIASTRLKSDSVAKMDSTSRRDTTLATSASISESHLTTESVKYKSFLRSEQNGSQVSSKVVTQDMCLQMLPLKNYPIKHNARVPKATEHNSSIKQCNYRDKMESCPLGQGVSDTYATLQKHLIVQSRCWQEPQHVYKEPAIQESVHETICMKNAADCDTGNQLTNCFQTIKNGDKINQQNYLHRQTLSKVTLSSPGRGRDKESRQSQLGIATIVKPEECVEKPVMTESDIYCKNNFEMHDQVVRNVDRTKGINTSQQCLERDQLIVISSSKHESKKGCSLLDTTYECAHVEEKQPNNSTVVSNSPNEMKLGLPSKMYVDKDINNCSHGPYTQEQRHCNELTEVAQHTHNNAQTGKIVRNLSGVLSTSRVIDKTWKRSSLYNLSSSSTCATTDNQTGRPVREPDNCHELVFVSRKKSEDEDTSRKEVVMQPRNVMKSVQVPFSKSEEMQSKTKRQILSRKAPSDYLYIKDDYRAINGSQSEVGIMKRQPQRRSMGLIDSPNTLFIHKHPVGSRNCVSSTLETVSAQNTYNSRCRDPCQILEAGSPVLKLPSQETKHVEISENSGAIHDAVNYIEDPNLRNVSFQTEDSLRRTRKRRFVQETDYFNQADGHFQNKKSQKELIFLTGFINAQEDSKTKKLTIDVLKPNVQSKSQTVHGELFHTHCQKDSKTLQNNNATKHKMKTTQFTAGVRNVRKMCNVSGISKSRMTKKGSTFQRHNNPVLTAKMKSGLTNKSLYHGINNSQVTQQVNVNEQSSNASRLFRAKTVKRALSFNTKRSPQITNNGKCTVANKKAASWTLGFRTPSLKTDNGFTHFGKENDYYENHNDYSSGSNKITNSKCMHLSPPLGDLNSSDPYEFKVTPVKLQQKSNVNNLKQTKTACQRRSKLRSKTNKKRNNRQLAAAKSVVCSTSSVSIRDLVEQKSKYLCQGINKVVPLTTMVHNTSQKNEGNNKKHLLTSGVEINIRNQCKTISKTELPGTETGVLMSENRLIKTSPSQGDQPREVLENLPKDESKLSSVLNSSSSKDTLLVKVLVPKNNTVATVNKTHFQSVATEETNTVLGPLNFEKKLPGNKQFMQNNEADELPVSCASFFPHHMKMDDHTSPGYNCSTVDFTQKSQKVSEISDNCNDEESSSDEEVLLLD